jgi:hypothetical protein
MSLPEYLIYWRRLRAMSAGEIAGRLRGNLAARWSRLRGDAAAPSLSGILTVPELGAEALLAAARQHQPLPVMRQLPLHPGEWFAVRWPTAHTGLLHAADAAAARRFTLFTSELSFDGRIDWHHDPLTGRSMPLDHWTAIPYWRPGYCPGVKHIWELNRHQHFVTLAQAGLLSGRESYLSALLEQWQTWLADNPAGRGINWTSALELGLRLLSWSWALQLAKPSPLIHPDFYSRLLISVHQHAEQIRAHLSLGSSANNHLLGEALGLVWAGICFPELKKAAHWRERGFALFWPEFERQVHADGVIKEQSTGYQRYLYDYGVLAVMAAEATGTVVPPVIPERLERMADFTAALLDEAGRLPQIGDGDDGQALLLDPSQLIKPQDGVPEEPDWRATAPQPSSPWRDLLGDAALRSGRDDLKARSAGFSPALFWRCGSAAEETFAGIQAAAGGESMPDRSAGLDDEGIRPALRLFPEGGYGVLRSRASGQTEIGVMDAGPLGLDAMAAHGHADALSFLLTAGNQPLLVDSGTFLYRGEAAWRAYFRGTSAHNTVRIAGCDQSQITGPFQWGRRADARFTAPEIAPGSVTLFGEHDGYRHLGVIHRRSVKRDEEAWIVEDFLLGCSTRLVELFWHIAPCRHHSSTPHTFVAGFATCRLTIAIFGPPSLQMRVEEGAYEPLQGWISPSFGVKKANPVLCINTHEALPVHITTEIRIQPLK